MRLTGNAILAVVGIAWSTSASGQPDEGHIDVATTSKVDLAAPEGLTVRARVAAATPATPAPLAWRHGGEGLGGKRRRGEFASRDGGLLAVGQWSLPIALRDIAPGRLPPRLFLTITGGSAGRRTRGSRERVEYATDITFELEVAFRGRPVKRVAQRASHGGTATFVIPTAALSGAGGPTSKGFVRHLVGVLDYARARRAVLESLAWAQWKLPRKYVVVSNVAGYGEPGGFGVRTADREVVLEELANLRALGVNALRDAPLFVDEMIRVGARAVVGFRRGALVQIRGYPVPRARGRQEIPEAGCPFGEGIDARTAEAVDASVQAALAQPVEEVWALTVDEIGAVIDRSREKKAHLSECARCAHGFQQWLRTRGLAPRDFGKRAWSEVRPLHVWAKDGSKPWQSNRHAALTAYYTRAFNNYSSAKLFRPLRDAFAAENAKKRAAIARGERSSVASQPWIYAFALRGNTFLLKGHSLDFFEFYLEADNAIVYETSNRDARVWGWDSYLTDVQRTVGRERGIRQGVYVKPHRGAPLQRMLAGVSRGATMIYWYTFGPDYAKGDSFSGDEPSLVRTSKAAHLLGESEQVLYGSSWVYEPQVALVKPETTQRWMDLLDAPPALVNAWENAKWTYTALQHAHVPVAAISESMLATADLSRYRVIYVMGSHITQAAAAGLERYVKAGGVLVTAGGGLARDEANQPLAGLRAVLGLRSRGEMELWRRDRLYAGAELAPFTANGLPPEDATLTGTFALAGTFELAVGREVLDPVAGAETLAHHAGGAAAVIRHPYGKGVAYVFGFYPGLEYSAAVRADGFDMTTSFDPRRRDFVAEPALARVSRPVHASSPLVEGILLRGGDGAFAVTLSNWGYRVVGERDTRRGNKPTIELAALDDVTVDVRLAAVPTSVRSVMLRKRLTVTDRGAGVVRISVPHLDEGDVLLFE